MEFLNIIVSAAVSTLFLLLITRVTGRRQISELTVFDYVNGISIGSIAAAGAVAPLQDIYRYLIAIAVFGALPLGLAALTNRSLAARHLISGKPVILFRDGQFQRKEMSRLHMDLGELLMLCRNAGYFDLSQIYMILMEPNGKISVLPTTPDRPATPKDLKTKVTQEELNVCVILDGELQTEVLTALGYTASWLQEELKKRNTEMSAVFLGTLTIGGKLSLFPVSGNAPAEKMD